MTPGPFRSAEQWRRRLLLGSVVWLLLTIGLGPLYLWVEAWIPFPVLILLFVLPLVGVLVGLVAMLRSGDLWRCPTCRRRLAPDGATCLWCQAPLPRCLNCGYINRATGSTRCSECGAPWAAPEDQHNPSR